MRQARLVQQRLAGRACRPLADDHQPRSRRQGGLLLHQPDECTHQHGVVLDLGHAPDRAEDYGLRAGKSRRQHIRAHPFARAESVAVDTVVDLVNLARRHANGEAQPDFEIPAHRNVVRYERLRCTAQHVVLPVLSIQVEHVAPVLAMHSRANPRGGRHELRLQRGQVAGAHQIGLESTQSLPQPQRPAKSMPGRALQGMKFDRLRSDATAKFGEIGQRDHAVAIACRRQGIEQVDHAVLQAAGIEAVDDMYDMSAHCPSIRARLCPIAGSMSVAKRASVATAASGSVSSYGVAISTDRPSSRFIRTRSDASISLARGSLTTGRPSMTFHCHTSRRWPLLPRSLACRTWRGPPPMSTVAMCSPTFDQAGSFCRIMKFCELMSSAPCRWVP